MINPQPSESFGTRLRQRWLLILFALPFAGVGVGFLFFGVIPSIWDSQRMQSWYEGRATLLEAGVSVSRGEDSDTYRAYATYTYHFNGMNYQNDRVAISNVSDNISDYHQELGSNLERALQNNNPVPVWINPDDPSEAVLNRDLRWSMVLFQMVFVLAFGGVGIGLIAFCLFKPGNKIPKSALVGVDVEKEPWLANRDWASATIYSNAKNGMWGIWAFAFFWNVISIPSAVFATPEVLDGNYAVALVYMFPLVGIGMLWWAISLTARWMRFGTTPLTMDPYPGSIGGQVGGTIDINLPYRFDYMFKTTVSCLYSYMSGSGKNRSRKERVIWQSEGFAHSRSWNNGTRLEILFDVDDNLPSSDEKEGSSYHLWRLNVSCELEGADFDRGYEIPVFPTKQSAKLLRHLSTEHEQAASQRLNEIESVLNMEQIPGGILLNYPAFKKPLNKLVGIFFGAFFFAAGMLAGSQGAPLIFPIVFGLVGGLIALASLYSLVVALNVVIDQQSLTTHKTILGIPIGGKQVLRQDIVELKLTQSSSQSSGGKHQQYFKIQAITNNRKKIDIGFNLAGRNTANQALESISLLTGLPGNK